MKWTIFHDTAEGWRLFLRPNGATYRFTTYDSAAQCFATLGLSTATHCINRA